MFYKEESLKNCCCFILSTMIFDAFVPPNMFSTFLNLILIESAAFAIATIVSSNPGISGFARKLMPASRVSGQSKGMVSPKEKLLVALLPSRSQQNERIVCDEAFLDTPEVRPVEHSLEPCRRGQRVSGFFVFLGERER